MLSPTSSAKKPKINGKDLAENNIFFFSQVHLPDELPEWLQPIYQLLIRRRTKIPCNTEYDFEGDATYILDLDKTKKYKTMTNSTLSSNSSVDRWDLQPNEKDFETAPSRRQSLKKADTAISKLSHELETCLGISEEFVELRQKKAQERDWQNVLQTHIFTDYQRGNDSSDSFK
ncbi:hypothetical protein COCC4DRAFT_133133 [Bipolaris maydis ATCC 48331]|uniref:Uncharacterized protein n=2 Tax=Cochliobolus heterostrophus TaxID=5016 RepID=M2U4N2_COCH5|nr:uncharacterized protein COCC4DRAFT_133133 [Bipolaris maydis ATCC 48331]EMD93524.1 hypothetical protein COCHEDRAFT_1096141 [Bipolaris maydis C5]ENI07028.1 hypothetical protein COCC4DRAFT_133133 [Bipolaris maydis ATCC 48331]